MNLQNISSQNLADAIDSLLSKESHTKLHLLKPLLKALEEKFNLPEFTVYSAFLKLHDMAKHRTQLLEDLELPL
jgi:hypothetical protein